MKTEGSFKKKQFENYKLCPVICEFFIRLERDLLLVQHPEHFTLLVNLQHAFKQSLLLRKNFLRHQQTLSLLQITLLIVTARQKVV